MVHIPGDEVGKSIGMVNFFNNKRGYGFITTIGNDAYEKDVFIHQTNIKLKQSSISNQKKKYQQIYRFDYH